MNVKEFTKHDWYGWAGAEAPKGRQPVIGYAEVVNKPGISATAVADATVIGIYFSKDDVHEDELLVLMLEAPFAAGKAYLETLPVPVSIKKLLEDGFEINSEYADLAKEIIDNNMVVPWE